jgi:hypothetical protein
VETGPRVDTKIIIKIKIKNKGNLGGRKTKNQQTNTSVIITKGVCVG